jgi:hypothetical protein
MSAKSQNFSFMGLDVLSIGLENRRRPIRVFDWNQAAKLILEKKPRIAEAGLSGDWEYTGGTIYEHGEIQKESYTYLASTWATPTLVLTWDDETEEIPCWTHNDEWDHKTKWPESALLILRGENELRRGL